MLKEKLILLPNKPGIYQMLDSVGKILYVGKAKNLKKRVSSYFRKNIIDKKTAALMEKVCDIETIVTENENQALLLEANLIKQHHPRYNIIFRDDKAYPYLFLSQHKFPRLDYARNKKHEKGRYFGPYPNTGSVRNTLALIQKLFKLRQCSDIFFKSRSRPCLQYQINRCTAPCVKYVNEKDYNTQVQDAVLFLKNKKSTILKEIKSRMQKASLQLEFEKAAHYRDLLEKLQQLQDQAFDAFDVAEQIEAIAHKQLMEKFEALKIILDLQEIPSQIECFDISHTNGTNTKASCVVFGVEGAIKKLYRQFDINNITPGDDYAAMKQVLTRRYSKNKLLPDLIIVDGGKGQLKQAEMVLKELNINHITLLGVAKGEGRKPGLEKLYLSSRKSPIALKSDHLALHLIQTIRDEAHRFAITAHRKKRGKMQIKSSLENIAGIGKKRRLELLRHFNGLQALQKASVNEISQVPGISDNLAKKIYLHIHKD